MVPSQVGLPMFHVLRVVRLLRPPGASVPGGFFVGRREGLVLGPPGGFSGGQRACRAPIDLERS